MPEQEERDLAKEVRQLREENKSLRKLVNELRAHLMGDREFIEVDGQQDLWSQVEELTDAVDDHSKDLAGMGTGGAASGQTREGRLNKVRQYLVRSAQDRGEADFGIDYKQVHGLFDGEISESYASQLLTQAAGQYTSDVNKPKKGFYRKKRRNSRDEIHVVLPKIEDRSFLRVKNSTNGEAPE